MIGLFLLALAIGVLVGWVDSRPTWDDTGITVSILLLMSIGFGAAQPRFAWLMALALGIWVPIFGILLTHNSGSLIALAITFFGAFLGAISRLFLSRIIVGQNG
jgi:hypothetical protein